MYSSSITAEQLKLYRSVFNGREDVFAVRWEKNGKGNYMPAFSWTAFTKREYNLDQTSGEYFASSITTNW